MAASPNLKIQYNVGLRRRINHYCTPMSPLVISRQLLLLVITLAVFACQRGLSIKGGYLIFYLIFPYSQ